MISTGCAKTSVWDCGAKQCRKVLLVMEPMAWSEWHCGLQWVTIPAWPKGGPLSAGSARPAKSRYQRQLRWWWHTQCQWNNYLEGDCAVRSLRSGSTLRFLVFHISLYVIQNVRDNIGFHAQHMVVWQYQPHDQWLFQMNWTYYSHWATIVLISGQCHVSAECLVAGLAKLSCDKYHSSVTDTLDLPWPCLKPCIEIYSPEASHSARSWTT